MATQRIFTALPLPSTIRDLLGGLSSELHGVRWTPVDQLHVTLRFLGDVEPERCDALIGRFQEIRVKSFLLPVERVGAFPAKGPPRVLWVGVGNGHPRLHQLRQQLDDHVLATGMDVELRLFVPHITMARCTETSEKAAAQWLRTHRDFEGPSFLVDAFELYSSTLRPAGAVHTLIERFRLLA